MTISTSSQYGAVTNGSPLLTDGYGVQTNKYGNWQYDPFDLTSYVKGMFQAGEKGAWFNPSDFSTMFQDSAGTTPVTAVEQPVGKILDKSGRGNHAIQSTSANRPVLSARVNLLLSTDTLATQSVTTVATSYKLYFTGTGTITVSGTATGTYSAGSNTITCTAGTLTLTVSGIVLTADLRVANDGVGLPPYQRVVTSTNYDTTGFPLYLAFNGTSSSLVTGSIDFTSTAQMSVFAGVRKLSTATSAVVAELSTIASSNPGTFYLFSYTDQQMYFSSSGTTFVQTASGVFAAPVTQVFTGIGNIPGSVDQLRLNGTLAGSNGASQGTGNYGNYPLYIGARAGTSLYFNGRLYSFIVRGATSSATQITNTENYVNTKTKAF